VVTIRDVQDQAIALRTAQGWPENTLEQQTLYLVTEVGEVAREVLNFAQLAAKPDADDAKERLGLELYDVVWNVCDIANRLGIDLDDAFQRKAALNSTRTW
jgi:NTP pyrophosphatase (non-canonical NTP hydrolase)